MGDAVFRLNEAVNGVFVMFGDSCRKAEGGSLRARKKPKHVEIKAIIP